MVITRRTHLEASRSPSPAVVSAAQHLDDDFSRLGTSQQREIRRVFEKCQRKNTKNHPTTSDNTSAGGFLPEEDTGGGFLPDEDTQGGFLPEEDTSGGFVPEEGETINEDDSNDNEMPLSRSRYALRQLNLDDNDEQVLEILTQAAQGWGTNKDSTTIQWPDFASVIAVLISQRDADNSDDENNDDDDVYRANESDDNDDDISEGAVDESDNEEEQTPRVTKKQLENSLATFKLFFENPREVNEMSLLDISNLRRVIKSLGEKITDKQSQIMLETISENKSFITYQDFTQMLLTTRLI
ncbi:hypothetical protein E3Q09_03079 [Wallemia mellicola]|nr:hypothetical protein E3Q09_03079 [Wallemia mellicola]